jgi:hypothetical protein
VEPFVTSTAELCSALGINVQAVRHWRQLGVFKPGQHFVQKTAARQAPLWWDRSACEEALKCWNSQRVETYEGDA